MLHYILLGVYGLLMSSATITDNIQPYAGIKGRYFFYNSRPIISQTMANEHLPTATLEVETSFTVFKCIDIFFGTRGWTSNISFIAGGMNWGLRLRPLPGLEVGVRHDSIHSMDNLYNTHHYDLGMRGWGQDQIFFRIYFGEPKKDNLFNMVRRAL